MIWAWRPRGPDEGAHFRYFSMAGPTPDCLGALAGWLAAGDADVVELAIGADAGATAGATLAAGDGGRGGEVVEATAGAPDTDRVSNSQTPSMGR